MRKYKVLSALLASVVFGPFLPPEVQSINCEKYINWNSGTTPTGNYLEDARVKQNNELGYGKTGTYVTIINQGSDYVSNTKSNDHLYRMRTTNGWGWGGSGVV